MNDKLIMESALLLLKSTVEVYVHGTLESSNKLIHSTLKEGLDEIMKMQFDIFNEMSERGWYKIKNIPPKDIKNCLSKLIKLNNFKK